MKSRSLDDDAFCSSLRPGDGLPWFINLAVTNRCNLSCPMCPRQYIKETDGFMTKRLWEKLITEIAGTDPDVIITTDDDAFQYVGLKIDKTPVVFNGMKGDPKRYLRKGKINSVKPISPDSILLVAYF